MHDNITIIIPTLHRKESVFRLLDNLAHTVKFAGKIIVVEQGENHATEIVEYSKKLELDVSYIYMKHPSTPRAMNMGVAHAKTDLVLFLDDDVLASQQCVSRHIENFSDEKIAATVGRCVTVGQEIQADYARTGRVNWLGSFSDGFSSLQRQEVDTVIGCNT